MMARGKAMLRILDDLPDNVIGIEASGKVTDEDYENVLVPAVRSALQKQERIRVIYVLSDDFDGWSLGAMWEDAKIGLRNPRAWEKVAIVSDSDGVKHMVKAFGWMLPGQVGLFGLNELAAAETWTAS
jgi:hypothetical protein